MQAFSPKMKSGWVLWRHKIRCIFYKFLQKVDKSLKKVLLNSFFLSMNSQAYNWARTTSGTGHYLLGVQVRKRQRLFFSSLVRAIHKMFRPHMTSTPNFHTPVEKGEDNWRGVWKNALSYFWLTTGFSFQIALHLLVKKRRIWHYIKCHLGPYFVHPFNF